MRRASAAIFTFLMFAAYAHGQAAASYVGYEYKGVVPETILGNGVRHLGGALISDFKEDPVYGISQVSKGKTRMLWLEVSTGQNEKGVIGWRVLDVLSFPAWTGTQHLLIAFDPAVECLRNGKAVEGLVSVGTIDRRRGIYTPRRAWIADIAEKKFTPASTRGIRCNYYEP